jgi:hypothetical protein
MYSFIIGPIIICAKILMSGFGFYLYLKTQLRGSLLFSIGVLMLALTHLVSRYGRGIISAWMSGSAVPLSKFIGLLNMNGYVLMAIGFIQLALYLAQSGKSEP